METQHIAGLMVLGAIGLLIVLGVSFRGNLEY